MAKGPPCPPEVLSPITALSPVTIHWLTALIVLTILVLGLKASGATDPAPKFRLLSLHVPLGWLVSLLTLARIARWVLGGRKPDPSAGVPAWQESVAMPGLPALHIGAAPCHRLGMRDGSISRMWFLPR